MTDSQVIYIFMNHDSGSIIGITRKNYENPYKTLTKYTLKTP